MQESQERAWTGKGAGLRPHWRAHKSMALTLLACSKQRGPIS